MKRSVFGILKTQEEAESVVKRLKDAGFESKDISLLFPNKGEGAAFGHEHATKVPEGASTGGTTGFIVGGVLGWLAGIGSLAIPGVGPFIAAGPLMAALTGAAVGTAVGGLAGALIGMGIPEVEAKHYELQIKQGNVLISIHSEDDNETDRAKDILRSVNAEDIASSGEPVSSGEGTTTTTETATFRFSENPSERNLGETPKTVESETPSSVTKEIRSEKGLERDDRFT